MQKGTLGARMELKARNVRPIIKSLIHWYTLQITFLNLRFAVATAQV